MYYFDTCSHLTFFLSPLTTKQRPNFDLLLSLCLSLPKNFLFFIFLRLKFEKRVESEEFSSSIFYFFEANSLSFSVFVFLSLIFFLSIFLYSSLENIAESERDFFHLLFFIPFLSFFGYSGELLYYVGALLCYAIVS